MNITLDDLREQLIDETRFTSIDSRLCDEINRILDLIARIFDVPYVVVTSLKRNHVELVSSNKNHVFPTSFSRNGSIFSYSVDLTVNGLCYIRDAREDYRFHNNELVVGAPYIRFYVGVPIMVENIAIGCISLMACQPRMNEYSAGDITSLFDFAGIISALLVTRRQLYVLQQQEEIKERMLQHEKNEVAMNLTHNLRTSLSTLNLALSELDEKSNYHSSTGTTTESHSAIQTARTSCYQLYAMIETNIKKTAVQNLESSYVESIGLIGPLLCKALNVLHHQEQTPTESAIQASTIEVDDVLELSVKTYFDLIEVCIMTFLTHHMGNIHSLSINAKALVSEGSGMMDEDSSLSLLSIAITAGFGLGGKGGIFLHDKDFIEKVVISVGGKCIQQVDHDCYHFNIMIPAMFQSSQPPVLDMIPSIDQHMPMSRPTSSSSASSTSSSISSPIASSISSSITSSANAIISPTANSSSNIKSRSTIKALVVEDSIMLQKMICRYLVRLDCDVDTADNGQAGLHMLMKHQYDIVFTDFLMPVMNGVTMMKEYQSYRQQVNDPSYPAPVIIGMSATAQEHDQHEAFQAGMNFFFLKPVNTKIFSEIISSVRMNLMEVEAANAAPMIDPDPMVTSDPMDVGESFLSPSLSQSSISSRSDTSSHTSHKSEKRRFSEHESV